MLYWLDSSSPEFPDPELALNSPNGLLAAGGNLEIETLRKAYSRGIFPWYEQGQPILWWSPDPRTILPPEQIHVSRSLTKLLRRQTFQVTTDMAFADVVSGCAASRKYAEGTWITDAMQQAYIRLHLASSAHSIECWRDSQLVGGLYGVVNGGVFCGESMFSTVSNASKVALVILASALASHRYSFIDCQLATAHLRSMGAITIARRAFLERLASENRRYLSWPDNQELAMISASWGHNVEPR